MRWIPLLTAGTLACGGVAIECTPMATGDDLAMRTSPYDSVTFAAGDTEGKVCYSRPFARERVVFGELVPFDTLWRTGANEPTIIHLPVGASIAGVEVEPGSYSIYTVPSASQWQVVVNASTTQWGLTEDVTTPDGQTFANAYTADVRAQEVGRAAITTDSIASVEQFTIRGLAVDGGVDLQLDWETTRATVPVRWSEAGH